MLGLEEGHCGANKLPDSSEFLLTRNAACTDLAQTLGGHPFLDLDRAMSIVQNLKDPLVVEALIPSQEIMDEMTVIVPESLRVSRTDVEHRLQQLKRRGFTDNGLVLVQRPFARNPAEHLPNHSRLLLRGYIGESELEFALSKPPELAPGLALRAGGEATADLFGNSAQDHVDLSMFMDDTPHIVSTRTPLEYVVEMFGKLGLRYLCVIDEDTGGFVGIVMKQRLIAFLDNLEDNG